MFTQRVAPHEHAVALYRRAAKLTGITFQKEDFVDLLSEASEKLQSVGYDIRETVDQETRVRLVVVVSDAVCFICGPDSQR